MWIQILVQVGLLLVLWLLFLAAGWFTQSHINPAHVSIQFPRCCYQASGRNYWCDFNDFWETLRWSVRLETQKKKNNMCLLDQFTVSVSWLQSGRTIWRWTLEKLHVSIPCWVFVAPFKPFAVLQSGLKNLSHLKKNELPPKGFC